MQGGERYATVRWNRTQRRRTVHRSRRRILRRQTTRRTSGASPGLRRTAGPPRGGPCRIAETASAPPALLAPPVGGAYLAQTRPVATARTRRAAGPMGARPGTVVSDDRSGSPDVAGEPACSSTGGPNKEFRQEVRIMPGFDGTGPSGRGPMTGGGRGWCNPYSPAARTYGAYRPPVGGQVPPAYGARPPVYGRGRPRWGLGRGFRPGRAGGRGRGRGRGRW
jgi:hypothetical protein